MNISGEIRKAAEKLRSPSCVPAFISHRFFSLRMMRQLFVAVILFGAAIVDLGAAPEWTVLENCRLIQNPANDGDSFHVSAGDKEYLFRLYLVDAPEVEAMSPGRLIEQAKYFEITVPQVIEVGEAAKEFTKAKLAEPFTIFTHMSDALGSSKIERLSAFVQTKGGDLGEQLVRNGLARSHGIRGAPPGLKTSKPEVEKLQELEDKGRQEKIGGWGIKEGRLNVRADPSAAYSFFAVEKSAAPPSNLNLSPASSVSTMPTPAPPIAAKSTGREREHASNKIEIGQLDINTATEKELETVPRIGPKIAARIIAARPFNSADDLEKVTGIGDKIYAKIRPYFK